MSNDPDEPNGPGGRNYSSVGGNTSVNIQGLSQATSQINAFNAALANMQTTLTKLAGAAPGLSSTISSAVGKFGSGGGPGGGSGGGGFVSSAYDAAGSMFGKVQEKGWMRDFLMFPTRFMRSAISDNRQLALMASAGLGQQAFGAGVSTQGMMGSLAGQFGNVLGGNPADLVNLMNAAGTFGAGIDWRNLSPGSNTAGGGPRAGGFFRSVFEAQRMSPGTDVGTLAGAIGGYAGNVGAQQQSAFLTGGAFSMIGAGNRQKSISEWATGILKWLQNIRGGPNRGRPFTYAELMSQNFPGSNIDAWLTANGVTPDMKGFFWSYALAQGDKSQSQVDQLFSATSAATTESVAYTRLKASAAETRTGFRLAGQMSGAYANKEQANQFFSELTGHLLNQVLPAAMGTGALSYMQYLPDTLEEIIMQLAERTGLGSLGAGVVGWGGSGALQNLLGSGDVGDVGDYGPLGGTSTAGLHPDARKRVDAMMAANPRVRVTSGFRDLGTQQRLKRKGVGRVSGRPSAHTRGMAADLGPASEYGWISRNARRFGLKSGRSQGEPWHVGMGDIGDPLSDALAKFESAKGLKDIQSAGLAETFTSLFGSLFGSFTGASTPEEQIAGIGKGSSFLMKMLMGAFGGEVDMGRIGYRNVFDQMVAAANAQKGLPTGVSVGGGGGGGGWGLSSIFASLTNTAQGVLGGSNMVEGGTQLIPNSPMAGGGSLDAFFGDVLMKMGYPNTANNRTKLAAIAKVEGNKSGTYNPFNTTGGSQFPKFNSVGVRNYPDWATGVEYTAKQLNKSATAVPGGPEMAVMRGNLSSDGTYNDWIADAQAFYRSWKGYDGANLLGNIPSGKASEMLTHQINAGDVDYYGSGPIAPLASPRSAPMIFQNHFQIDAGGAGGGGVDVRRTATLLADQLEQEMHRRMARRN